MPVNEKIVNYKTDPHGKERIVTPGGDVVACVTVSIPGGSLFLCKKPPSQERKAARVYTSKLNGCSGGGRTYLTICRNGVARLHDCIAQHIE